ncbi:hypothetical protein OAS39_07290, partial [Pirellulales bacterium]|nr:hypothetical protein [Pirellulales bacterium]
DNMHKPHYSIWLAALVMAMTLCATSHGEVAVISNRTEQAAMVTTQPGEGIGVEVRLPPGETQSFFFTGRFELVVSQGGSRAQVSVTPGRAYYIARREVDGAVTVEQIGLGERGPALRLGDAGPSASEPSVIPVKLLLDEDEPTRRDLWEPRLRERLEVASEVFALHAGIRFRVVSIERWDSNDRIREFEKTLREFEREVDPAPARVAIGFSSQYRVESGRFHLGGTRGALHSHILIKERATNVLETERRELLVHELGHFLGASHSVEPNSVMRPILSGGLQRRTGATIKFDPVNSLLMSLVSDEMRRNPVNSLADLSAQTRRRMGQIYTALQPTLPDDPAAGHLRRQVAGAGANSLADDVRTVSRRILGTAARRKEEAGEQPIDGDQLLSEYVRAAARGAQSVTSENGPRALVLALGLAVDDAGWLRRMPTTEKIAKFLENDRQAVRRLELIGRPTMHGRSDLARHFFISAHLTAAAGANAARGAGLAKELIDAQGGSGFSFADMAANRAGIVFATAVINQQVSLKRLAQRFETADFLPPTEDLVESLGAAEFALQYGDASDPRYLEEMRRIEERIKALPVYLGSP